MYAEFDFLVIEGTMRFVNPRPAKKLKGSARDNDSGERKSAQFLLPETSLPSSMASKFQFRWRGRETGEDEIQLGSDEVLCSINFESPNALRGTFRSDLTGVVDFQGFKSGTNIRNFSLDPGYEWDEMGEDAYERARVGRWH